MSIHFIVTAVEAFFCLFCYFFFRQNFEFAKTKKFLVFIILITLNSIIIRSMPSLLPNFWIRTGAWISGLWLAWGFYLIISAIIMLILRGINRFTSLKLPVNKIASLLLLASTVFTLWGFYRAMHPVVRTEKIITAKLPAGEKHRLVLASDIHLGQMLGKSYSENLVQKINGLEPEMVLIAGDLLDQRIVYVNAEDSLTPLKNIKTKLGTYLAFGNHDYLDRPFLWQEMCEKNNIHVLRDAEIKLGNLKITGLNDYSRHKSSDNLVKLSAENKNYYSILLDHQPRRMDAASEAGYDLYLAGHTHTGQLWPSRIITKRMYKLDYGRKDFGKLTAITSNGYGFWGRPVRTEVAPELVVIELEGK